MGSCLGRCISKQPTHTTCIWRQATDEQEADLMSNASEKRARRNFIFRILKFKRKHKNNGQFIDKFWEHRDLNYAKLTSTNSAESASSIQLQNLDVNHLFTTVTYAKESALNSTLGYTNAAAVGSSRASSSLDLEWEHEYVHIQRHLSAVKQEQKHQMQHDMNMQQTVQEDNHHQSQFNEPLDSSWQLILHHNDHEDDSCQLHSYNSSERDAPIVASPMIHQQQAVSVGSVPAMIGGCGSGGGDVAALGSSGAGGCQSRGQYVKANINRNGSFTRTSSHNSWSHISTPESLEWDIDEDQQRQMHVEDDNLDHETLQLLHQIEQLKNRVLNETGDGLEEFMGGIEIRLNQKCDLITPETIDNIDS